MLEFHRLENITVDDKPLHTPDFQEYYEINIALKQTYYDFAPRHITQMFRKYQSLEDFKQQFAVLAQRISEL